MPLKTFYPGLQVLYVPNHAEGDTRHPDVQYGFVTSVNELGAFCRFFRSRKDNELRTSANSELAYFHNLVIHDHHSQLVVQQHLTRIEREAWLADE